MKQPPFRMERWQSHHEHRVGVNLSESGVEPLTLTELAELTGFEPGDVLLGYPQTDGTGVLRERIAALYPGAGPEHVVVTSGSAEANFVALWRLLERGDRVVVVEPAYAQTRGLAEGFGCQVVGLGLRPELGWQPAPGAIRETIRPGTRLVVVTNPNNPTGAVLSPSAVEEIAAAAEAAGAWLLADEVYAGAELSGEVTPGFWGLTGRTLVSASLSKAYGLPGLRLGWLVCPAEEREGLWARKDYTTIAPSALSDAAATAALEREARARLLERGRRILRENLARLSAWVESHRGTLEWQPPRAGAIAFLRYGPSLPSEWLAERLRAEHDVLVVPGAHFGTEGWIRIGYGYSRRTLAEGLPRISALLEELA